MAEKRKDLTTSLKLDPSQLKYVCDADSFSFETTDELEEPGDIIGQERALRAIELGLEISSFGYNIYVAGVPATGKKTLVRSLVERIAADRPVPNDLFFVHNFSRPDHPRAIEVEAAVACRFKQAMDNLIETLQEEVPKAFKSQDYESRRDGIVREFQQTRADILEEIQRSAREKDLAVKAAGPQLIAVPVRQGKEITGEQFSQLDEAEQKEIRQKQESFSESIQHAYRAIRKEQLSTQEELNNLDRQVALIATGQFLDEVRTKFEDSKPILEYLEEAHTDMIDNIGDFLEKEEGDESELPVKPAGRGITDALRRYQVNVVVDNGNQQGAPVIAESQPTYRNLIGLLEREARMGTLYTDFTMIRAGSVLAANGGFLLLDLADLLTTPLAWDALKRVLQDEEVRIQDPADQYGVVGTYGLRPEPVKVRLKVLVLGSSELYNLLYAYDEDFQKLFKIKADFETVMKRNSGELQDYARFVKKLCTREKLRHFNRESVAGLIEYSCRMVSDRRRLSLRFSEVADLIREASYWAEKNNQEYVRKEDLDRAVEEKIYRSNLLEEKIQEMIDEGSILIDAEGEEVGQVNGLSVYQMGDYAFGKPTRITAAIGVGEEGVVNVEREARMSGSIHDKGVLILSGYLEEKYGAEHPLSLNASICFEQSYSGVDGDSASSAELYTVLSALTKVPLRQSIAVTGSINQKGVIQPIGGVNEKIEGFFTTCRSVGLNGRQGVVIPVQNIENLMLKPEIIRAVEEGKFNIFAVKNVDQGIEILFGRPAGERQKDGTYPKDSIHHLAQRRLNKMAAILSKRSRD